jgi:hypothetical protein
MGGGVHGFCAISENSQLKAKNLKITNKQHM